jgi:DNA (cytosine-5)-methyltransferase 1
MALHEIHWNPSARAMVLVDVHQTHFPDARHDCADISQAMECLGYRGRVVSANSMHHGVAQSRDRVYVVWARAGINIDLEFEQAGWCGRCERVATCRQAWKTGRSVGRYRSQWVWRCVDCGTTVEPAVRGAADIIDWDLPVQRIGDRARPLAANTRRRIAAGLARYGWRPLTEPLPTQQATVTSALAVPFLLNTAHGGRIHDVAAPHPTVCASDDRLSLITTLRGTNAGQIEASARPVGDPLTTVAAGGIHHGLLMSYYGHGQAQPTMRPVPTVPTRDRFALVDPDVAVDDCGFRMLEPQEVAAAMAFPDGYIPSDLSKKDRVKLAGNAVTPPVMTAIAERIMAALREAA